MDETPKKNIFKENWLKTDICCDKCGQVTEKQKGITKQNIKRLFSIKFDMNEFILTFIIIMVLVSAYAYKQDIQVCKDYVKKVEAGFLNMSGRSYSITNQVPDTTPPSLYHFNFSTMMNGTG